MPKIPKNISQFALLVLFICSCALIFFLIAITFRNSQDMQDERNWVYHSADVVNSIEKIYEEVTDLELNSEIGKREISSENNFKTVIFKELQTLKNLVTDNPEQSENVKVYQQNIENYFKNFQQNKSENSHYFFEKIKDSRNNLIKSENILLKKRRESLSSSISSFPVFVYLLSLLCVVIIFFAFYELNKDFGRQKIINQELTVAKNTTELAEKIGKYGVWQFNPKTRELSLSKNLAEIFETDGISKIHRNDFWKRVHKDDAKKLADAMGKVVTGKNSQQSAFRYLKKDGTYRDLQTDAISIPMENGENILVGVSADISEVVKDKNDLKTANDELKFYNEISHNAEIIGNYGFWRWDSRSNNFWFSDNLHRIFGIEKKSETLPIETFLETIHPEDKEFAFSKLSAMYSGEDSDYIEFKIFRKSDGELRFLRLDSKRIPISDDDNLYTIITHDITEEKEKNKLIEEKNQKLEEANQELTAFTYIASHDLQEPLRKIETFTSRIKIPDEDTSNNKVYVQRVSELAHRMRTLISDLLKFSRTGRQDEAFVKTDLNEILNQSIEDSLQKFDQKEAKFNIEKLPELSVIPFQIQQLFSNLIQNSIKYCEPEKTPEISVKSHPVKSKYEENLKNSTHPDFYKITFQDNGIGFENEYAEKIFDLFVRLHSKNAYEGTGIGLAICKKIMKNHHGCIFADSKPGIGTEFQLYFPI